MTQVAERTCRKLFDKFNKFDIVIAMTCFWTMKGNSHTYFIGPETTPMQGLRPPTPSKRDGSWPEYGECKNRRSWPYIQFSSHLMIFKDGF